MNSSSSIETYGLENTKSQSNRQTKSSESSLRRWKRIYIPVIAEKVQGAKKRRKTFDTKMDIKISYLPSHPSYQEPYGIFIKNPKSLNLHWRMAAIGDLQLLQEIDLQIEEILLTANCSAWNEKKSFQILDGLLFIVKRTVEPRFQIILKPAWPVDVPDSGFGRFHWVEGSGQIGHFEEEEPRFLFPSQTRGFVVFFNNLEDSTRALNCIKRLVDTARTGGIEEQRKLAIGENAERLGPLQEEEQRGSVVASGTLPSISILTDERLEPSGVDNGTPNPSTQINIGTVHVEEDEQGGSGAAHGTLDPHVYLQNTRVILAMIAVLLATIVLSVGLNPPSTIHTLSLKIIFQITFWIAAVFSLAALFLLGLVTPTTFDMQARIFRFAFMAISVALICVLVAFGATTVSMTTNLIPKIVGGFIGLIGIIIFSYFSSRTVRDFIFTGTGFRLTQHVDNLPYWLTN